MRAVELLVQRNSLFAHTFFSKLKSENFVTYNLRKLLLIIDEKIREKYVPMFSCHSILFHNKNSFTGKPCV